MSKPPKKERPVPPLKRPTFKDLEALSEQPPPKPKTTSEPLRWPSSNPLRPAPADGHGELGSLGTQSDPELGSLGTQSEAKLGTQATQCWVAELPSGTQPTLGSLGTQSDTPLPVSDAPRKAKWKDDRPQLNTKISWEKLEQLKAFCFASGMGQKEAIEHAIDLLTGRLGTQTTQTTLGTQKFDFHRSGSSLDDVDLEVVNIVIAGLFVEIVGREMNPTDWELYREWLHHGRNAVLCAIIAGGIRKKGQPIGGFAIFENIIPEMASAAKNGCDLRTYKNKLWQDWLKVKLRYGIVR